MLCRSDGATIDVDANKITDYQHVLDKMRCLWPQYDIDGLHNMWIVKPGDKSKGVGKSLSVDEYSSPVLLVFLRQTLRWNSDQVSFFEGVKYTSWLLKLYDFPPLCDNISKTTQHG